MTTSAAAPEVRGLPQTDGLRFVAGALFRATTRDLTTLSLISFNNFFLFVALILYGAGSSGVLPVGAYPFLLLLGLLLLFPLSADPLAKIPAARLALWPLGKLERAGLRLASVFLSPMFWLSALLLWPASRTPVALAFLAVPLLTRRMAPRGWMPLRHVPGWGERMRKDLRQMFSVLDTWLAMLLEFAGIAGRARSLPGGGAGMAWLVALALSTYAQCLFSLDGSSGMDRYRLVPIPGWRILAAKDLSYLLVLLAFVLPLDPAAGLTFGLVALAAGRYPALRYRIPVKRWRFTAGRLPFGILQIAAGSAAAFAESKHGVVVLPAVCAVYLASLWQGDRLLRRSRSLS